KEKSAEEKRLPLNLKGCYPGNLFYYEGNKKLECDYACSWTMLKNNFTNSKRSNTKVQPFISYWIQEMHVIFYISYFSLQSCHCKFIPTLKKLEKINVTWRGTLCTSPGNKFI